MSKFENKTNLKKKILSFERRFFQMNNLFYRKNLLPKKLLEEGSSGKTSSSRTNCSTGRTFFRQLFRKKVLSDEQFIHPEELFSEKVTRRTSSGRRFFQKNKATGRTSSGSFSGIRFFWQNNLFIRKNLLPEKLSEELLPVASSEESSSGRTICSTGRTFFRKKELFFFLNQFYFQTLAQGQFCPFT